MNKIKLSSIKLIVNFLCSKGKQIKMTKEHVIAGGRCGDATSLTSNALIQADQLQLGDCLQTLAVDNLSGKEHSSHIVEEAIISKSYVFDKGIYTLVTKNHDDLLIVNGIVASPFAVNHRIANVFYTLIHRFLYHVFPINFTTNSFFMKVIKEFGDIVVTVSDLQF